MPVTPSSQVIADAVRWEGERLSVYVDSRGYFTQGIGRHVGVKRGDPDIDVVTSRRWFAQDWDRAYQEARDVFWRFDEIDNVRRDALAWLAFNMGAGTLATFVPLIGYVKARNWDEAAFHLLTNTRGRLTPYLVQVGARGAETALRIATGDILEEFQFNG